jgi:FAD-dependent oxidoreductase domain-containing protein 1
VFLCTIAEFKFGYIKLIMDDVVIVGGGIIGTSVAYFLSKEGRKVKVIERDPTYKQASFPLSLGGFRRQFFQKENIMLGKFAREFIFQIPELLKTEKNPNPTASMVANGYLLMFGPEHAQEQYKALENHKACKAGTKNIKGSELSNIFPYINNEGIETATFTDNQSEGWIDPFMFHSALKSKAMELGAEFTKGNVKSISEIKAKTIISAAGCWTNELLSDIPVVPQKHTVFRVKCPTHIPEMPLTGDLTTGVYWRPEGKEYLAGSPNSIFDATDLEPAWNDFEELVWPALAKRIPAFEKLKLTGGWAGYYDCNKLDNNAVVGKHPKYDNVYMASGFTGRGLMQAPGIGRALTELITTGSYQTIDISDFAVERVLENKARPEPYVL